MYGDTTKILIIDDEQAMREGCRQIFNKEGYQVDSAKDGLEGLEKLRFLSPDLVLVDLKMPKMGGMEVLEKIREFDPDIVPIVITGYASIESAVEAMQKGAYDFLPKPFSPEELRLITRRAIEKRMLIRKSKELQEERDLMKERFISMVTHQLKSPIGAVLEYFEVILGGMAGEVNDDQKMMLERSRIRLQELLKLIHDWLDFARIDKDEIIKHVKPADLIKIMNKELDFIQPVARQKNISIQRDFPESFPTIMADEASLVQVFSNLFDNAIKYNKEDGSLTIKAREDGNFVQIEVADTGIGIPQAKLPFIFDQFFRVKRSKNEEGTGLGLCIVKKIIDAHCGTITVQSEPDNGTVFKIKLPKT
ncbi:hybrid sensor histidine kinase/response regulator [bacterium]|nr:hybrid sensor histidine kinase/response regulator [bacterium]